MTKTFKCSHPDGSLEPVEYDGRPADPEEWRCGVCGHFNRKALLWPEGNDLFQTLKRTGSISFDVNFDPATLPAEYITKVMASVTASPYKPGMIYGKPVDGRQVSVFVTDEMLADSASFQSQLDQILKPPAVPLWDFDMSLVTAIDTMVRPTAMARPTVIDPLVRPTSYDDFSFMNKTTQRLHMTVLMVEAGPVYKVSDGARIKKDGQVTFMGRIINVKYLMPPYETAKCEIEVEVL